jgi:predicted metal-binding membrane protein
VITQPTRLEALLRHERAIVAGALVLITVLAWAALLQGAGTGMSVAAMTTWSFPPPRVTPEPGAWDVGYWLTMLAMWWVMMVAMMLPSAAPMILLHARVAGAGPAQQAATPAALGSSAAFTTGYLACWLGFSALAVALQFALEGLGLLDGMSMWSVNRWLTGGLLIAAALYQLSPIKRTCLAHCRAPAAFLAQHRRPGERGAFRLGLIHGSYCLGCCWVLMLLLFAAGIMNLVWIVGLAALVLAEKLVPFGRRMAPITAGLLAAAGLYAILGT